MDDKTIDDTAEYKFDDSEDIGYVATSAVPESTLGLQVSESDAEEMPAVVPKLNLGKINWRKAGVPAGIVIAILALYVVFTLISSKKTSSSEQTKIMMQENAATVQRQAASQPTMQQTTPSVPLAPVVTPLDSVPDKAVSTEETGKIDNMVQQQMSSIEKQSADYGNSISNLNEEQQQTHEDLSVVTQQVEQLVAAMQYVLTEQQKVKKAIAPKPKKKVAVLPESYHVRAIVPGRVWLESDKGKSVSLRVGSKLEGYGEVKVISSRQGMVVMSNGSIIQYDVDDI